MRAARTTTTTTPPPPYHTPVQNVVAVHVLQGEEYLARVEARGAVRQPLGLVQQAEELAAAHVLQHCSNVAAILIRPRPCDCKCPTTAAPAPSQPPVLIECHAYEKKRQEKGAPQ
jgi:hypothetical protein